MKKFFLFLALFITLNAAKSQDMSWLSFDGMSDHVYINGAGVSGTNKFSLELQIRIEEPMKSQSFFSQTDSLGVQYFTVRMEGGEFYIVLAGGYYKTTGFTFDNCVPHNMVVTFDGTKTLSERCKLFWDGQPLNLTLNGNPANNIAYNPNSFALLGASFYNEYISDVFVGAIGEFAHWNKELIQTEIQSMQYTEITSPQPGLIGYSSFNQGINHADNTDININFEGEILGSFGSYSFFLNGFSLVGGISNFIADPKVIADAGENVNVCESNAFIQANYEYISGTTANWTTTGEANIVYPYAQNTQITDLTPGANIFIWNVARAGCTATNNVVVTHNGFTTNAGMSADVCGNAMLSAMNPAPGAGMWSFAYGTGNFINQTQYNTMVNIESQGEVILRWTVQKNGCSAYDEVAIINNKQNANAGEDRNVCMPFEFLTANMPGEGVTGVWSSPDNTIQIDTPNDYNSTVSNLKTGNNIFTWTLTKNGCNSSDNINIFLVDAEAANDLTVCSNTATLSALAPTQGVGYWTHLYIPLSIIQDTRSNVTTVTDLEVGMNGFLWNVETQNCTVTDTLNIYNNSFTVNAGDDFNVCEPQAQMTAEPLWQGATGQWANVNGFATFVNATNPNTYVTGLQAGSNILRWTVTDGSCVVSADVIITNNMVTATTSGSIEVCDNSATLTASAPSQGVGYWTLVSAPTAIIANTASNITTVTNLNEGENIFTWNVVNGTCSDSQDLIVINNSFTVYAGDDFTVCEPEAQLMAEQLWPGATGQWTAINSSAIFVDATDPNTYVTGLQSGNNILRWTVTDGECIVSADVIITNDMVTAVTADDIEVCTNSATLMANNSMMGTGSWDVNETSATISNPTLYNSTVTNLQPGENIFIWTVTYNECYDYDELIINYHYVSAYTEEDFEICENTTDLYGSPLTIGETGEWNIVNSGAIIADKTAYNTTATGLASGINIFTWTVTKGECSELEQLVITNNEVVAEAGDDILTCNETVQLTANVINDGYWDIASGFGLFSDNTSALATVSNMTRGVSQFTWNVTKGNCFDSDTITVTNMMVSAYAGENISVCQDSTYLFAEEISFEDVGNWTATDESIYFSDPADRYAYVHNLKFGANILRWNVANQTCNDYAEVIIYNNKEEVFAGDDFTACETTAQLQGNIPTDGTGTWCSLSPTAIITNSLSPSTTAEQLAGGVNTFVWKIQNAQCESTDTVNVLYEELYAYAGENQVLCYNNVTMSANDPTPHTGKWTRVIGEATIVNPMQANTEILYLSEGDNIFRWIVTSQYGCQAQDDVTINFNNIFNVSAGEDQEVILTTLPQNGIFMLNASAPTASATGMWTSDETSVIFATASDYNTTVSNLAPGYHTLTWTVSNEDCFTADFLTILVRATIHNVPQTEYMYWNDPLAWTPEMVPTEYDNVIISGDTILVYGYDAKYHTLAIGTEGYLGIFGNALTKEVSALTGGNIVIQQDIERESNIKNVNATLEIGSGGNIVIQQDIERKAETTLSVGDGGNIVIQQDIEREFSYATLTLQSGCNMKIAQNSSTAKAGATANVYVGDGGNIVIQQDIENKIINDRIIVGAGGEIIVDNSYAVKAVDAAILVEGGNIVIQQDIERIENEAKLWIKSGTVEVRNMSKDKAATASVNATNGGNIVIQQDIENKAGTPELITPLLYIANGHVLVGDTIGAIKADATLTAGNIVIQQDIERLVGNTNLVVGYGATINLDQALSQEGTETFISTSENASITILEGAQIISNTTDETPIIILSDGASLIDNTEGQAINGNIVLEKNISTASGFIASPIMGAKVADFAPATILNWNEATPEWTQMTPENELQTMKGYFPIIFEEVNLQFTGTLNYGAQSTTLYNSAQAPSISGWNLLGNPYTSAIDFEQLQLNGIENTIYKYNPATNSLGVYQQGTGISLNGGDQTIATFQGFFLKTNNEVTTATLDINTGKFHNIKGLQKTKKAQDKYTADNLVLTVNNETTTDQIFFGIEEGADKNFESNKDAFKYAFTTTTLFSVTDNQEMLAINIFDIQQEEIVKFPVFFHSSTGEYQISANTQIANTGIKVTLHDLLTNETADLRTENYTFSYDENEEDIRFEIIFDYTSVNVNNIKNSDVVVYSNSNNVYIKIFDNNDYNVEIYNLSGVKLFEKHLNNQGINKMEMNLANGVYIVKVHNGDNTKVTKVFIN